MSEIKMFRIITGEFIIAQCEESPVGVITKGAMVVNFQPQKNGQLGIRLFPLNIFASSTNEEILIKSNHIMFNVDSVQDEIKNDYLRITTGLVVANTIPELKIAK